jgi:hypothetical protein
MSLFYFFFHFSILKFINYFLIDKMTTVASILVETTTQCPHHLKKLAQMTSSTIISTAKALIDHSQMDHSKMDHSKMDHSNMEGMDAMQGMDHSSMGHSSGLHDGMVVSFQYFILDFIFKINYKILNIKLFFKKKDDFSRWL